MVSRLVAMAGWRDADEYAEWALVLILALADGFGGGRWRLLAVWLVGVGMGGDVCGDGGGG